MNVNLLVGWHNNLLHKYIKVHKTARQDEYRMNNLTNIHCKPIPATKKGFSL